MLAQTLAREAEVERTFRLNVIGETQKSVSSRSWSDTFLHCSPLSHRERVRARPFSLCERGAFPARSRQAAHERGRRACVILHSPVMSE